MNDVNTNSPGLKLVSVNGERPARISASSQASGSSAPARVPNTSTSPQSLSASAAGGERAGGSDSATNKRAAELEEKVSQLNDYVQSLHRNLEFQVDRQTGQTVVKVVDQETNELIRQIPDEVALRLAEKLHQDEPLTLLNIEV